MAELLIRLLIQTRKMLLHVTEKLLESDNWKALLEKWSDFTSFIHFNDNMLDAINSKHYEHVCDQLSDTTLRVQNILGDVSLAYKISGMQNLLGHQVHQSSKLYREICNPFALFGDKFKPYQPSIIPGVQSYATYNLLCDSLVNNFYIAKQHKESGQLLKCHYILHSVDNRKHMTTTYVSSREMRNLAREIIRELLGTRIKSDFGVSRRCFHVKDTSDMEGLIEINQKVFEEVEKGLKCVKLLDKIDPSSSEDLKDQATSKKSTDSSSESSKYVPLVLMAQSHTALNSPLF